MKRRLLSVFIILCMLMLLIPAAALAADEPGLYWYRVTRQTQDDPWTIRGDRQNSALSCTPISGSGYRQFVWFDGQNEKLLNESDLDFDGPIEVFTVENGAYVSLGGRAFGTGSVSYAAPDGKTYSIAVNVVLPDIGCYDSPTASEDTYLFEFPYGGPGADTFYIVPRSGSGYTLTSVTLSSGCASDVSITFDPNGAYAEVTVNELKDTWLEFVCDGTYGNGSGFSGRYVSVSVVDNRPGLYWHSVYRQTQNDPWTVSNERRNDAVSCSPGSGTGYRQFVWFDGQDEKPLKVDDLVLTGPFSVSTIENGAYIYLRGENFGTGSVSYAVDGKTYSIDVNVELPKIGCYNDAKASKSTYLRGEFVYGGAGQNVFYIVPSSDSELILTNVKPGSDCASDVSISLDPNGAYATVTVNDLRDSWLSFEGYATYANGNNYGNWFINISVVDNRPGLYWHWVYRQTQDDPWTVEGDRQNSALTCSPGSGTGYRQFVWFNGQTEKPLNESDLDFDGPIEVFTVENGAYVYLQGEDFGTGSVSYTTPDGETYEIAVNVVLPTFGCYDDAKASESTYLRGKFAYGGPGEDTFYIVPGSNWYTLTNVTLRSDYASDVSISLDPNGAYAEVTVNDLRDTWLEFVCDGTYGNGGSFSGWYVSVSVVDNSPGLYWQWFYRQTQNDPWTIRGDRQNSAVSCSPGSGTGYLQFVWFDGQNEKPLTESDLDFDGPIEVFTEENGAYIYLRGKDFGTGSVSYAVDGKTYKIDVNVELPDIGCYDSPTASDGTYLFEFVYGGPGKDVFYIVPRSGNGYTLTNVTLDSSYSSDVSIEVNQNENYAKITVNDLRDTWLRFVCDGTYGNGSSFSGWYVGVSVVDNGPGLYWHEVYQQTVDNPWTISGDRRNDNVLCYPDSGSGYRQYVWFDGQTETPLTEDKLVFTGPFSVSTIENGAYIYLMGEDFGTGSVSYTTPDGKTYEIAVSVVLPPFGCYDSPTASPSTFLKVFSYDGPGKDVFYVVPGNGSMFTLSNVTLGSNCASNVTINLDPNGAYAEVTVNELRDTRLAFVCDGTYAYGGSFSGWYAYVSVVDNSQNEPDEEPETEPEAEPESEPAPAQTTATVDEEGNVTATVSAEDAADGAVTLPVEVRSAEDAAEAPDIQIDLPEESGPVTVEIPVENVSPADVVVLVHADGTEELIPDTAMTENGLKITADADVTVKVVREENGFEDVPEGWQKEAVDFVAARGLFIGVSETEFAPEEPMDRAMIVTVVYRLNLEPDTVIGNVFDDVPDGKWYSDAIAWASAEGIVKGYGDNCYGPTDPVTREQLIVILWRMAGQPEADAVETGASDWASEAMSWAVGTGILLGDGTGYNAQGSATRAETAAILMRYINL